MERPAKRLRMSPSDEKESYINYNNAALGPREAGAAVPLDQETPIIVPTQPPTRTLDPRAYHWRRPYENAGSPAKRNSNPHLYPRAPDITVTANIVRIAILDGSDKQSFTEIVAPSTNLELSIAGVGTVTIPGVTPTPRPAASGSASVGSSSTSADTSATASLLSISSNINGTSTGDKTVTVTATSLLSVSVRNGTIARSSSSRHRIVVTADGFTTTIDDSSSNTVETGYRFGDVVSSTATRHSGNEYQNGIASATSSSNSQSTTTAATGPGVVLTPQQQQVVGGVVGGIAGIALVLLGILYLLRWYRHRLKAQGRSLQQPSRHRQLPSADDHQYIAHPMTLSAEKSFVPMAALKHSLQKMRPHSTQTVTSSGTERSSTPLPESERGFQRVAGRKIPSALFTGGDGYGGQGPVSPESINSSFPRSRDVSQISCSSDCSPPSNPFITPVAKRSSSVYSMPLQPLVSPFLDPPTTSQDSTSPYAARVSTASRDVANPRSSRSQLSVQTGGLSALNPTRSSDGSLMIRPSPARTPTTTSPNNSNLKLPMHTPPLMSGDIPEVPPLQPWRHVMGPRKFSDDTLGAPRGLGQRSMSGMSVRSSSSVGGKFREEI